MNVLSKLLEGTNEISSKIHAVYELYYKKWCSRKKKYKFMKINIHRRKWVMQHYIKQ